MSDIATTPADSSTTTTEDQQLTPPDPRRRDYEPSLKPLDRDIESLTPFNWPERFDRPYIDGTIIAASNAVAAIEKSYATIIEQSTLAFQKHVDRFWHENELVLKFVPPAQHEKAFRAVEAEAGQESRKVQEALERAKSAEIASQEKVLDEHLNTLTNLISIMPHEAAFLTLTTPNSPELDQWQRRLSNASHGELKSFAMQALTQRNPALRCAVANELGRRENPPIRAAEFARRTVGQEYAALTGLHAQLSDMKKSLTAKRLELVTRQRRDHDRIGKGLRQLAIAKLKERAGE